MASISVDVRDRMEVVCVIVGRRRLRFFLYALCLMVRLAGWTTGVRVRVNVRTPAGTELAEDDELFERPP